MRNLSVVISAFNEEKNIKDCLESVKDLDSEIIVVDNSSTDKTGEIANKYTKNVFTQKNDPQKIDLQKNFGFQKATCDWVLSLDADERVTPELAQEIKEILQKENTVNGYWIPRKNIIFGKWIQNSIWWPDYQLRLFRKGKGKFLKSTVHTPLEVEGETQKLTQPMVHENYQSISQYIQKLDTIYTENEAKKIMESGQKLNWTHAITFPVDDFLKTFFLQKGYKDGLHGLVLSILQAFYAEIVFAKVWEAQGFNDEKMEFSSHVQESFLNELFTVFKENSLKFRYWFLTSHIQDTSNIVKKISLKVLRKKVASRIKK